MTDPSAAAPPEVPSPLQVASWERLGVLPADKVPLWGAYWIAAGRDGEALIYLAGLHEDDPREVHDALPRALRDCGVEMPGPGAGAAAAAFTDAARLEVNGLEVELSQGERLQYDRAVAAGRDISAPVEVTYFFGLGLPGARPVATEEALSALASRKPELAHVTDRLPSDSSSRVPSRPSRKRGREQGNGRRRSSNISVANENPGSQRPQLRATPGHVQPL